MLGLLPQRGALKQYTIAVAIGVGRGGSVLAPIAAGYLFEWG